MTYPPQGPGPGNSGPYGQVPPGHGGRPQQPYPRQSPPPQGFSPQGPGGPQWQAPQDGQPHQQQWAPQQQPQWGQQQQPNPPGPPGGKSPAVLIGVAAVAVLAILIGVVVVVTGGEDDSDTTAKPDTTSAAPAATTESSKSPGSTTTKSSTTTSTKAAAAVPSDVQPILDAMPAALRSAVAPNFNRTTTPGYTDDDSFTVGADFNILKTDSLIAGLTDSASKDRAVLAHISTDPSKLPALWRKQFPDRLTEQGNKLIRFNEKSVSGALEYFNTDTNLFIAVTGFKDKASALTFIERAGL